MELIYIALTFCLGNCVFDFGPDVMHTVIRKDQGQAERGHKCKTISYHISGIAFLHQTFFFPFTVLL